MQRLHTQHRSHFYILKYGRMDGVGAYKRKYVGIRPRGKSKAKTGELQSMKEEVEGGLRKTSLDIKLLGNVSVQ